MAKQQFVIPPYKSINLTKGKRYQVVKDYGDGDVEILNDKKEQIPVATQGSVWTFGESWKVV